MTSLSITEEFRRCETDSQNYPLLSARWISDKYYPLFSLPNDGITPQWLADSSILISLYSELLTCPFDKFWCEMMHQTSLPFSLDSFLQWCPRNLNSSNIPPEGLNIIRQLYALVLLITLRATKSKSTEGMHIRPFEFGNILYDNFIFDAPRLIDFAALYEQDFGNYVNEVFTVVFEAQPKYINDAVDTVAAGVTALDSIAKRVLDWNFEFQHQPVSKDTNAIADIVQTVDYIVDAGRTLGTFLTHVGKVTYKVAEQCIRIGIIHRLMNFYNDTIMAIRGQILRNMAWTFDQKSSLMQLLAMAAGSFVKMVRQGLIEPGLINRIMQLSFEGIEEDVADPKALNHKAVTLDTAQRTFLDIMMKMLNCQEGRLSVVCLCVDEGSYCQATTLIFCKESAFNMNAAFNPHQFGFAAAYAVLYPVDHDVILIQETSQHEHLDKKNLDYINQCFSQLAVESSGRLVDAVKTTEAPPSVQQLLQHEELGGEPRPGPSRPAAFYDVKAVLPHTEEALIERCLAHYKGDPQMVVDAILDHTVPVEVLDPDAVRKAPAALNASAAARTATANLDLATAAATGVVELSADRLWQGKRPGNTQEVVSKPLTQDDRERVLQLACSVWDDDDELLNQGWQTQTKHHNNLYDDEYDDTYDLEGAAALERVAEEPADEDNVEPPLPVHPDKATFTSRAPPPVVNVNQPRAARGASSVAATGTQRKHRYRQKELSFVNNADQQPAPRSNVLPLENPELVRERKHTDYQRKANRTGPAADHRGTHNVPPQPQYRLPEPKPAFDQPAPATSASQPPYPLRVYNNHPRGGRGGFSRNTPGGFSSSRGGGSGVDRKSAPNGTRVQEPFPPAATSQPMEGRRDCRFGSASQESHSTRGNYGNQDPEDCSGGDRTRGRGGRGGAPDSYGRQLKERYGNFPNRGAMADRKRIG